MSILSKFNILGFTNTFQLMMTFHLAGNATLLALQLYRDIKFHVRFKFFKIKPKAHLEPSQTSKIDCLPSQKVPSYINDWVLNTPLKTI